MPFKIKSLVNQLRQTVITPELAATLQLRGFGLLKAPLILVVAPKVIHIDRESCKIQIALNKLTRNHLGSMYFGALCIGADVAGGLLGVSLIESSDKKFSFAFKDVQGEFFKRAESDVLFECSDGPLIKKALDEATTSGERKNIPIHIKACCPKIDPEQLVARFTLTFSFKLS